MSRLGIGTLQWGDPGSGFGTSFGEAEIASAFDELVAGGINFFDTAEVYFQMQRKPKLNGLEFCTHIFQTQRDCLLIFSMKILMQVYGYQNIKSGSSSEQLLGKFLRSMKNQQDIPPVLATKFFTIPWTNFLVG